MDNQILFEGPTGVNQMGGTYINGKALPDYMRQRIIILSNQGLKAAEISRQLRVSHGCVSKLLRRYKLTGSIKAKSQGGSKPTVAVPEVIDTIHMYKEKNPTIFAWEIREKLLLDEVCNVENVPSISSINRIARMNSSRPNRRSSLEDTSISSSESASPPETKKSPTSFSIRDILGDNIDDDEKRPTEPMKRRLEDPIDDNDRKSKIPRKEKGQYVSATEQLGQDRHRLIDSQSNTSSHTSLVDGNPYLGYYCQPLMYPTFTYPGLLPTSAYNYSNALPPLHNYTVPALSMWNTAPSTYILAQHNFGIRDNGKLISMYQNDEHCDEKCIPFRTEHTINVKKELFPLSSR